MKKLLTAIALFFFSTNLFAVTKVDPLLKIMAERARHAEGLVDKMVQTSQSGLELIDCFIKTSQPELVASELEKIGGYARTIAGNIMTAYIPIEAIEGIAEWEEIDYIEASKPLSRKLDDAKLITKVSNVQAGSDSLPQAYTGSGVIVGVVDVRLDWDHPDFQDSSGKTRILSLWQQSLDTGSGVSEIANSKGIECTNTTIDDATCQATTDGIGDADSHGTHVTGIAAGSDSTYKGVAPEANIIFVMNATSDADSGGVMATSIVDGVNYIFKKALAASKPSVVNLSLGTSIGAHDGTSTLEQGLDNLIAQTIGRAIVNAAGNENFSSVHTGFDTFGGLHADINTTSGNDVGYEFMIRSASTIKSFGGLILDIWLTATSSCTIEIDSFDSSKASILTNMSGVSKGSSTTSSSNSNFTLSLDFTDSANANNGKQHAVGLITLSSTSKNITLQTLSFDLIFRGDCTGDAWIYPDNVNYADFTKRFGGTDRGFGYTYVDGDSNSTMTIPATAKQVIAVGSFNSEPTWTDSNGTTYNQTDDPNSSSSPGVWGGVEGGASNFSSRGPTGDNRTKPDVSAPGEPIISTKATSCSLCSSNSGRVVDTNHFKLEGTSMASPHVAGIVALLFEKNKCQTPFQIKTALTGNTTTDSLTGDVATTPDNTWGYGKVNALAAIQAISDDSDCTNSIGDVIDDGSDSGSSSSTSTSCSQSLFPNHPSNSLKTISLYLIILAGLFWRKKWHDQID